MERLAVSGAISTSFILFFSLAFSNTRGHAGYSLPSIDFVIGALLLFSVTNGVVNWATLRIQPTMRSGIVEGQLGTPDLQIVSDWIIANSEIDDIIASNAFFNDPSLIDTCSLSQDDQAGSLTEVALEQNYFAPVVLTKRRFVAAAPRYGSLVSGIDFEPRVRSSLLYACNPTEENRRALEVYGADWYLAYLPGGIDEFSAKDEIVFASGQWLVVKF